MSCFYPRADLFFPRHYCKFALTIRRSMKLFNLNISASGTPRSHRKWISFMIHLLVLALLFMLPDILITISSPDIPRIPLGIYLKVAVYIIVFYLNYFIIIDRTFLPRPHILRFFLINLMITVTALALLYVFWCYVDPANRPMPTEMVGIQHIGPGPAVPPELGPPPHELGGPPHEDVHSPYFLSRDFIIIILTIGLAVALRLNTIWRAVVSDRNEMDLLRKNAELVRLRNQLNPHFLFNTLNAIYALVDIDPAKAQSAIHRLSKMLRYMLYESHDTVAVEQECAFITAYIELMKLRLAPDFPLKVSVDCSDNPMLRIHPLLSINIIENAFKFGMRASGQRLIDIRLTVQGTVVSCLCTNRYTPQPDRQEPRNSKPTYGIGLENLRRRLQLRYPSAHTLEITSDGSLFTVALSFDASKTVIPQLSTVTSQQS